MTMTEIPTAVHIGADDLPWVDIGDGSKLKVVQVNINEGPWIVQNIFQAGYVCRSTATRGRSGATRCPARGSTRSTTT